jgi:hypothetical protein
MTFKVGTWILQLPVAESSGLQCACPNKDMPDRSPSDHFGKAAMFSPLEQPFSTLVGVQLSQCS